MNKPANPKLLHFRYRRVSVDAGQYHQRNRGLVAQGLREGETVHARHDEIADDQIEYQAVVQAPEQRYRFSERGNDKGFVKLFQQQCEAGQKQSVIVDHRDLQQIGLPRIQLAQPHWFYAKISLFFRRLSGRFDHDSRQPLTGPA